MSGRSDHGECGHCGAEVGEAHDTGCDVARCLWTGGQRISCDGDLVAACCRALRGDGHDNLADDLAYHLSLDDEEHDCGNEVWSGEWPGKAECREFGWWVVWGPDIGRQGWVSVPAEGIYAWHAQGVKVTEDLNRLVVEGVWDRAARRWRQRERAAS